jgi:hypothetical protein
MSDYEGVEDADNVEIDMGADPFDDVVEIEPVEEPTEEPGENEEPQSEPEEGDEKAEPVEEEPEDSEKDSEEPGESDKEPESEEGQDDEATAPDLAKQLEEGTYEVEIGEEKVTLKDLKNSYQGQKEIARRFTEYDKKSKQLEADTTEINGYINEFAGKLRDGDSIGAMQFFGEFAGVAPYMIKEQLIAALRPEIIRREQMTAADIQNEYLQNQNDYLLQQRESDIKRQEADQAQREVELKINSLRETNSIDEDTWHQTEHYLGQTLPEGETVTPELVAETINYGRMYEQAESVIKASGEQLDNTEQWIEELVNVKEKHPDFTEEDLAQVLKGAVEQAKSSSVEKKLAEKIEKMSPSKNEQKQSSPVNEEEIDPELDDWF